MSDQHSKLLINEEPLQLLPSLAMAVGFNEAVVLQQLQYWMRNPKIGVVRPDGRKWVFNTYEQWHDDNFPFWSLDTVKRAFLSLEKQGVVLSDTPGGRDRKKWYTINYGALNKLTEPQTSPSPSLPSDAERTSAEFAPMHQGKILLSDVAKSADASGQNPPMVGGRLPLPSGQSAPVLNKVSESTTETTQKPLSLIHPHAESPQSPPASASGGGESRSRFSRKERLAYYQNKPSVKDPEALANAVFVRRGEADEEIAEWYASNKPVGKEPPRDVSACPDCEGLGMYEPGGKGRGYAKCSHPRLVSTTQLPARASPSPG